MVLYVIDKSWNEPAKNLAYEKCLMKAMEKCEKGSAILFLWQNSDVIVLGRNQNFYKECDVDYVKTHKISFLRRITGGGAVYHDRGNLNYSFICKTEDYDRRFVFEIILTTLSNLGINAKLSGRNDITVGDRKISGSAFTEKDNVVLHHGTFLVETDLEKMEECLTPHKAKLLSKGIQSVKSRVANLTDIKKDLNIHELKELLVAQFIYSLKKRGAIVEKSILVDEIQFREYTNEFLSKEWNYGNYPSDYETISERFSWGVITIHFVLEGYSVRKCRIESDTLYSEVVPKIEKKLVDVDLRELNNIEVENFGDFENDKEREIMKEVLHFIEKTVVIYSV